LKRAVEVNILGSKYILKTDVPDKELNEIVNLLNKKINDIKKVAGTLSTSKLTILTAIYLAAENYWGTKKIDSLIKKITLSEGS